MSLKLLLPPHPRMILLGMLPHKVVIYFSVPFIFPIQWVGVGAHHVAIYSAQHRVATEMGKAQFLPSRSSESSCRQTTQCFGISEVSWVAENQVNIFEEMFNRHHRMVADFQVEQGKKDPSSQENKIGKGLSGTWLSPSIFMKDLLCLRPCSECRTCSSEQRRWKSLPTWRDHGV